MLLKDYESAVARAATPEAVWATFSEYFRDTVVDRLVYLHLPPIGAPDSGKPRLRAEGFAEELMIRYLGERLYRDNPMLRHAHQRAEPVYWDEVVSRRRPTNANVRSSRSFGRRTSATGSAFLSSGRMGAWASAGSGFARACGGWTRRC